MKKIGAIISIILLSLSPLFCQYYPSESEVKTALQSTLVATAATAALSLFTPPLQMEGLSYSFDPTYSAFEINFNNTDIGQLRLFVLSQESPLQRQMSLFEALFASLVKGFPSFEMLVQFLKPNALGVEETFFSGEIKVLRLSDSTLFRYEGKGAFRVSGKRYRDPFFLQFSFQIPLEGPYALKIIPLTVEANEKSYLDVAKALFGL